jgi:hypothetical protein
VLRRSADSLCRHRVGRARAIEDLVRRGRARGIGITLVTQHSAVLNKDVLTQAEVLVALRTIAPQDREAIDAWIKVHGTPAQLVLARHYPMKVTRAQLGTLAQFAPSCGTFRVQWKATNLVSCTPKH